jgi:dTDP-4-dehydrorhamnose reductase
MKILIFGGDGQLGKSLRDAMTEKSISYIALSRDDADICNSKLIQMKIEEIQPSIVINAAAYTNVDGAEDDMQAASLVNDVGVENIALCCSALNIPLIHFSTDYVFNGASSIPYKPSDPTNPLSIYGQTKLAGELKVQKHCTKYLIIRTSWLFSHYPKNFLTSMIDLSSSHTTLSVVGDQTGCPTNALHLSQAIIGSLGQILHNNFESGIYHYSDLGPCGWNLFANKIFDLLLSEGLIMQPISVLPVKAIDYSYKALRPKYSVLDCNKFYDQFHIEPAGWELDLKQTINLYFGRKQNH